MNTQEKKPQIKRTLGTFSIVMMVVAATAPLTVVAGTQPLVMLYAQNNSIPVYYLATGIILVLFSVGFTAMSKHVPNAGAFYSYIQAGLGRKMGMGAATMALLSYTLICIAVMAYLGYSTSATITLFFPQTNIPWYICALVWWAFIAYLGYHNIDMSSKVLGIFLVLEVAVVTIVDLAVVLKGGATGLDAAPFTPSNFLSGTPGMGLMWAFFGFIGYEATAVFRSEAKDPDRTIPRATYLAVAFIALFYGFSAWCLVMGAGSNNALAMADKTQDGYALAIASAFVGRWLSDFIQCLLVTSLFACMLSLHNVAARYTYTLADVKVLPAKLAEIHPKHYTPSNASLVISLITFILLAIVTFIGLDPLIIYAWFANAATLGLLLLQCLTSVSVIVFFRRFRSSKSIWHTVIAPAVSTVALGFVTFIIVTNFSALTGDMTSAITMGLLIPTSFALGSFLAGRMEKKKPREYELLQNLVSNTVQA